MSVRIGKGGGSMALTRDSPLQLRFPADPRWAAVLRARIGLWLDELGAGEEEVFEISLACNEAFANAVQHAYEPTAELVDIQATNDTSIVTIVVRDYGTWASSPNKHDGSGLALMHELMDSVQVNARLNGTSVSMRRKLVSRALAARAQQYSQDGPLRVHVDDSWLLQDLCDYLAADGCLAEPVARSEAEVSIPGAANAEEAAETLRMELLCWEGRHESTHVSLVSTRTASPSTNFTRNMSERVGARTRPGEQTHGRHTRAPSRPPEVTSRT
jgi:anti-sigma regulatory factor (Ser/Thr protein kinase)